MAVMIPSLEPQERIPFFCTAVASACAAAGALTARAAADTLFLDAYGAQYLPLMYVGTSILVGSVAFTFGRYASRVSLSRLLILSCLGLGLVAFLLRFAMFYPWSGFRVVAYFWGDLTVNGSMLLFWSFFGQVFSFRRAKKLLGWVGAGGTSACIAAGFLIGPFANRYGYQNLLVAVGVLMALMASAVLFMTIKAPAQIDGSTRPVSTEVNLPNLTYYFRLLKSERIRSLAFQAMIGTMVVILVDYQFKALARAHYSGPHLASFFGDFYALTNVLVLLIQLFALHLFFQGKGLMTSLCILPAGLLLGGSATIISAAFVAVVMTKLIAQTTLFTIDSGAFQILYLGIKKQTRTQVRALVDGICRPAAIGITGAVLVLISGAVKVYLLSAPGVILCVLWFFLARRNYALYLSGLVESLSARMLDLAEGPHELNDRDVEEYTRRALPAAKMEELPYLLSVAQQMDHVDWSEEIRSLLQRPEPEVKIAALEYLISWGRPHDLSEIIALSRHPVAEVRRAAVRVAGLGGETVMQPIRESLEDHDPGVRAEAASALIDMGHFGGLLQGVTAVKGMLESEDKSYRMAVASPVSRLKVHGRTESLVRLLADPEAEVRLAALRACANTPEAGLVAKVIPHLWITRTAGAAADALIALGPLTADYLSKISSTEELAGLFRKSASMPVILEKIGSLQALEVLKRVLDFAGAHASPAAIQAYCRIIQRQPSFEPFRDHWETVLRCHIEATKSRKRFLARATAVPGNQFLLGVLVEEYDAHVGNVFTLLGIQATDVKMEAIRLHLQDKDEEKRARAQEVLEHVLPTQWRNEVMALVDTKLSSSENAGPVELLRDAMETDSSEAVLLGAIYTVAQNNSKNAILMIQQLLTHPSAVVRETALFALAKIAEPEDLAKKCNEILSDSAETVRRLAQSVLADPSQFSSREESA